jgi:hypothetical protein
LRRSLNTTASIAMIAAVLSRRRSARARLVQDAGDALWCFMVQREACGLRDPRPVLRDYRVPPEVQNRMGIFTDRRRTTSA